MKGLGVSHHQKGESHFYRYAAVGAVSSAFHDLIMTPAEAIKQRLQLLRAEISNISSLKVIKSMYKMEGIKAFYRTFAINYFTSVPFSALIVMINEELKDRIIG